jgi:sugar O-acyltransferase (sialic acid O-acetyltransferase NeuD family)
MADFVVVGGGGHAKVVISVLKKAGHRVQGYTDRDDRGAILGAPYLGTDDSFFGEGVAPSVRNAVIGVGKMNAGSLRLDLQRALARRGVQFPVVCSPDAIVNEEVTLGAGTVLFDGAIVNSGSVVGEAVILNTRSLVEHDCRIGNNVHLASGVTLAGAVSVGDNCMIGTGTNVIQSINICAGCIVGAGATVVDDITVPGTYVGTPAKRIK